MELGDAWLQFAAFYPAGHRLARFFVPVRVIEDEEAFHLHTVVDEQPRYAAWPEGGLSAVVQRDRPAADDPAVGIHPEEGAFENVAAGVIEVHINPVRGGSFEGITEVRALVVHRFIKAKLIDKEPALFGRTGDPDDAALLLLSDLSNHVADRPRS